MVAKSSNDSKIIIYSDEDLSNNLGGLIFANKHIDISECEEIIDIASDALKKDNILIKNGIHTEHIEFLNCNKNELLNTMKFAERDGVIFLTIFGLLSYASRFNARVKDEFLKRLGASTKKQCKVGPRYRAVLLTLIALRIFSENLGINLSDARLISGEKTHFEKESHDAFYSTYLECFTLLKDMDIEYRTANFSEGGKANALIAMKARLSGLNEITGNICDQNKQKLYLDVLNNDLIDDDKLSEIFRIIFTRIEDNNMSLKIATFLNNEFAKYNLKFYGGNKKLITNTRLKLQIDHIIDFMKYE